MFICVCKGITEQDIIFRLDCGQPPIEVKARLSIAEECGTCQEAFERVVEKYANQWDENST